MKESKNLSPVIESIFLEIKNSRKGSSKNLEYITVEEFFNTACENESAIEELFKIGMTEKDINQLKHITRTIMLNLNKVETSKSYSADNLNWLLKSASAFALNINKPVELVDMIKIIIAQKNDDEENQCAFLREAFLNLGVTLEKVIEFQAGSTMIELELPDDSEVDYVYSSKPTNNEMKNQVIETSYLSYMSSEENIKRYSDVIGREKEIVEIVESLNKKKKSSVLLVGEAGVGKTAIVEGLAKLMANGEIEQLSDYILYQFNPTNFMSNIKYQGELEERFNKLINLVKESPKKPIIFIDEIHGISGQKSSSNPDNGILNMLKPYLASGVFKLIGSTTLDEKYKFIDSDKALLRRFDVIKVEEPSEEDTLEILNKTKGEYETHHNVSYSESIIENIVKMSIRYMANKKLPDKAFDIIDRVGVKVKSRNEKVATMKDVIEVVSVLANISSENISDDENELLLKLEAKLKENIFGQDEAIEALVSEIMIAKSGLGENGKKKPLASFMLAGPTGVGKTEIVNELSRSLNMGLIRIDMSEYTEKHSVSNLIGSPKGYIGSLEGGVLIRKISENPYSIVLFDEIEKSHPDVRNILLQFLDNGFISDKDGNKVDCRNTIVVLTTNAGSEAGSQKQISFSQSSDEDLNKFRAGKIKESLEKEFKPELRNRLDHIIYFNSLSKDMSVKITNKNLNRIKNELKDKNITLEFSEELIENIALSVFNNENKNGARPIERKIKELVSKPLSISILKKKIVSGDMIKLSIDNEGKLRINKAIVCKNEVSEDLKQH